MSENLKNLIDPDLSKEPVVIIRIMHITMISVSETFMRKLRY